MVDEALEGNTAVQRIIVLGANGFIGGATLKALQRDSNLDVLGVQRTPVPESKIVRGDVTEFASLSAAFDRADAVIHAASYIGYDEAECERVNVQGTANVTAACAEASVRQLIYVSTAAVYGAGVHRGARESELVVAPNSALSASRARAEELVLETGGIVIRPHFVVGPGDKWIVPGILKLVLGINGLPERGRARHSAIDVGDLGEMIAQLAVGTTQGPAVFHAAAEEPLTLAQIVRSALSPAELNALEDLTREQAHDRALRVGLSARHIDWLADDHVYDASAVREAIGARWVREAPPR